MKNLIKKILIPIFLISPILILPLAYEAWQYNLSQDGRFHDGMITLTLSNDRVHKLTYDNPQELHKDLMMFLHIQQHKLDPIIKGERYDKLKIDRVQYQVANHSEQHQTALDEDAFKSMAHCECQQRKLVSMGDRYVNGLTHLSSQFKALKM